MHCAELGVKVANKELWSRKIFPRVAFEVNGVDPLGSYSLAISIVRVDNYKYKFEDGKWVVAGHVGLNEQKSAETRLVQHHDGFIRGSYLLKTPIYFDHLSLTNDRKYEAGAKIYLQTMCKYRPVLSVCRVDIGSVRTASSEDDKIIFSDEVMEFIAVTQYQNARIIQLKNQFNPYAKGQRYKRRIASTAPMKRESNASDESM
ncbi:unnamed protein product [Anisakis simplex]|uniref:T-related protein (inferred by orthology to a D. melanogaster protein) n=1 Tax=Anisakis simplex TaxID=6269 RepID=A0A0M3JSR3_ANISI|nr:unnamed protein product [Anisakis simplex]